MTDPDRIPPHLQARSRFRPARIVIPLAMAIVVLAILADRIPELGEARDRLLHPTEYQPLKACQAAALAAAGQPAYARIRSPGQVHATQEARYVEGVRVGEMGPNGAEVTYEFSCYIAPDGRVVKTHKRPPGGAGA
jgi:hypothetical protein